MTEVTRKLSDVGLLGPSLAELVGIILILIGLSPLIEIGYYIAAAGVLVAFGAVLKATYNVWNYPRK